MPSLRLPRTPLGRAAALGLITSAFIAGGIGFADAGAGDGATTTPIKHVVVLFQENTSFDHYFGTYPNAVNGPGDVKFTAAPGTPAIDGLTPALLTANPNKGNPTRLGPADVVPKIGCANTHDYTPEQLAFNGGLMNKFVENTQGAGCSAAGVLDYYDGNTVTGLWNYAQHYAMSDRFHGTGFGPSTIGAIQLISGNTSTAGDASQNPLPFINNSVNNGTVYRNQNPYQSYDGCSTSSGNYALDAKVGGVPAKNVGDLLNAASVSWGWFQAGFTPTDTSNPALPVCGATHKNVAGATQIDYDPHHNPFSYYQSTSNPRHKPPTTGVPIGDPDAAGANHQYDQSVFDAAVKAGNLPAVSFVKAGHYQDGHPGNSDPVDEQTHLVNTINAIQASPDWASTAIIIAWDDSDGWYDHQVPTISRASNTAQDALNGAGTCGPLPGQPAAKSTTNDRCGFGPRLPFLVISPYAKQNYVDHTETDQSSILRFIEDNWSLGRIGGGSTDVDAAPIDSMFDFGGGGGNTPKLLLEASTGAVPGAARVPTPTPATPSATPTPAAPGAPAPAPATPTKTPVVAATPTPTPTLPPVLGKLTCKGKLSGSKKVMLTCTAKKSVKPKTAVRARLMLKKTLLGTASATVKGTKVTITIKTKKAVKRGTSYSLSLSIQTVGSAATAQTGKLKL